MPQDEVVQIRIDDHSVGIMGLKKVLEAMAVGYRDRPERDIKAELLTRLEARNYIPTSARDALLTAQVHALERLKRTLSDPTTLARVNWALLKSHAELEPISISEETLATYAGLYGRSNRVTLRDGTLFVHHAGFPESPCTPLAQDLFEYEGDGARVHFLKEGNQVTEAVFQLESGQEFRCPRTSEPE